MKPISVQTLKARQETPLGAPTYPKWSPRDLQGTPNGLPRDLQRGGDELWPARDGPGQGLGKQESRREGQPNLSKRMKGWPIKWKMKHLGKTSNSTRSEFLGHIFRGLSFSILLANVISLLRFDHPSFPWFFLSIFIVQPCLL